MKYLNVSLLGLTGRAHPAITGVTTTYEVQKMRPHLKMLYGNYPTFEMISLQSGGSSKCRLCSDPCESTEHLISQCSNFDTLRSCIKLEMNSICEGAKIKIQVNDLNNKEFTQFLLDPSSMNLRKRVNINDSVLPQLFKISHDFCYTVDRTRARLLKPKS